MARTAEQTAHAAETAAFNQVGMCLQQCRTWAGIGAKYPDATTAARHAHRHAGTGPRGSFAYWTGGSHGHGHIAINLGGGKIRSTDAGGAGHVATVPLGWIHDHWGLTYAGWAWDVNDVSVVHTAPKPPAPPKPTGLIVDCMHASMQFSDNPRQHKADANRIFARAQKIGARWITGTEAGPGSDGLGEILSAVADLTGYRFYTVSKTDGWIAVKKSFIASGWKGAYHELFPGKAHLHSSRGILSVEFNTVHLGHVTIGTGHYLTHGQVKGDPFYPQNLVYAAAIGTWGRNAGRGSKIVFYGGDQNTQDRSVDTFRGQPFTSLWDELHTYESTGHGVIDVIASYNGDNRVKGHSINALTDAEFPLNTDHFLVEGAFEVQPL